MWCKGPTLLRFIAVILLPAVLLGTVVLPVHAGNIRVGIGFAIPPYVIKDINAGVEVDIIREAFKAVGHEAEFVYLPNLRLPVAFADGIVDCIASNAAYDLATDSGVPAYYSDVTVVFQNYAITLDKNGFTINSISDLADKSVLGFNNAIKYLGEEYAAMAEANERYSELADQALQVRMLFSGRVDVVVSDMRIFRYWRKLLIRSSVADAISLDQRMAFHPIFSAAPRHVGFRDDTMRDLFNKGLAILKKSGAVAAIEKRYSGIENR